MTGRLVDPLVEGRIRGVDPTETGSANSAAVEFSTDPMKSEDFGRIINNRTFSDLQHNSLNRNFVTLQNGTNTFEKIGRF